MKRQFLSLCAVGLLACTGRIHAEANFTAPIVSPEACPAEAIAIAGKDGNKVTAVVRKPPGKGPFPALIHLHGGLGSQSSAMLKELSLHNPTMSRFLAAGYVTVNPTF